MAGEVLPSGSTNTQGLADWASPYITNYLGQAQALAQTPYQTYQGPLTAGASDLQNKVFNGLAGLTMPTNLGQSFASPMGGQQTGGPLGSSSGLMGSQLMPDYLSKMGGVGASRAAPTDADWNQNGKHIGNNPKK
jgi:hypothetical protein